MPRHPTRPPSSAGLAGIALAALLLSGLAAPGAHADEPAPLPAFLPAGALPPAELARHGAPHPELAERLRSLTRMRADESVEVRSFGDQDLPRRVSPTPGPAPSPLPQDSRPAFSGITQISQSNQPPCAGSHAP